MKRLVIRNQAINSFVCEVGNMNFYRTLEQMEAAKKRLHRFFEQECIGELYCAIEEEEE